MTGLSPGPWTAKAYDPAEGVPKWHPDALQKRRTTVIDGDHNRVAVCHGPNQDANAKAVLAVHRMADDIRFVLKGIELGHIPDASLVDLHADEPLTSLSQRLTKTLEEAGVADGN